jgi:hypothetical protein
MFQPTGLPRQDRGSFRSGTRVPARVRKNSGAWRPRHRNSQGCGRVKSWRQSWAPAADCHTFILPHLYKENANLPGRSRWSIRSEFSEQIGCRYSSILEEIAAGNKRAVRSHEECAPVPISSAVPASRRHLNRALLKSACGHACGHDCDCRSASQMVQRGLLPHCAENEATDPMLDGRFASANVEDSDRAQAAAAACQAGCRTDRLGEIGHILPRPAKGGSVPTATPAEISEQNHSQAPPHLRMEASPGIEPGCKDLQSSA